MEDSFHNIPTKRICTCLHDENNIPEKYCLHLQLIMYAWKSDMQDIAIRFNEYTKAVREYKEILKNDPKKLLILPIHMDLHIISIMMSMV